MKKSITTIASALLLIAILASCGGNKPSDNNSKAPDTSKTVSVDDTSKNASKDESKDDSKEEPSKPETKEAFTGTVDEILDLIVKKAGELDSANEYNISTIACSHSVVDIDSCDTILGLEDKEFEDYVEAAVESKPDGSWFTHSVVVVSPKKLFQKPRRYASDACAPKPSSARIPETMWFSRLPAKASANRSMRQSRSFRAPM